MDPQAVTGLSRDRLGFVVRLLLASSSALGLVLVSTWSATALIGDVFGVQAALGPRLATFDETAIYPPWAIFDWTPRFADDFPKPFAIASNGQNERLLSANPGQPVTMLRLAGALHCRRPGALSVWHFKLRHCPRIDRLAEAAARAFMPAGP